MKRPELKDFVKASVEQINLVFLTNPGLYKMLQAQDAFIEQLLKENKDLKITIEGLQMEVNDLQAE